MRSSLTIILAQLRVLVLMRHPLKELRPGEHERLGVGPQARLQQERQLGVAVRHVRVPICDRGDDVTQVAEALVDGLKRKRY